MAAEPVALAHDYATQRGGAERVALFMAEAFPGAPMYTTLYHAPGTFPEFQGVELRTSPLNRVGALRRHHRAALPLLPAAVGTATVDAQVLLASSTGWAHGYHARGRKIVYCHAPARWLYQRERYLGTHSSNGGGHRQLLEAAALGLLGPSLRRWDRRAALSADRYLANSTVTAAAIRHIYGMEAVVLPPPPALVPSGPVRPVDGVASGFVLCVARLLPYKNVDVVVEAIRRTPDVRLVVVGDGPDRGRLERMTRGEERMRLLGRVDDASLRWLYGNSALLVGASYEDYGLSPVEAAAFGKPSVTLRAGGYLDTVREGVTGSFFDEPSADAVATALESALRRDWDRTALQDHAASLGAARFVEALRAVVAAEREFA